MGSTGRPRTVAASATGAVLYAIYCCTLLVALDFALGLAGFGYPRHYREENIERFPSPYDMFAGKPDVEDHNELGFRKPFIPPTALRETTVTAAFLAGSTGYQGDPPIAQLIEKQFQDSGIDFQIYNFSSISSNHSQHVHRLLKYIDKYNFDFVIFYGGGNESIQHAGYDPRPGYPYNFFYRNELSALWRFLIEHSSIVGEIDRRTQLLTGLRRLRAREVTAGWSGRLATRYLRDLDMAERVAERLGTPNGCPATSFLSITQPAQPEPGLQAEAWSALVAAAKVRARQRQHDHVDLTDLAGDPGIAFTDIIHVTQDSRVLISGRILEILLPRVASCQKAG